MQLLIRQRGRREKCHMYCDALSSLNRDDAVVGGGLWNGGATVEGRRRGRKR